jgi:hypothetical protein
MAIKNAVELMVGVQMDRMEIFYRWPPTLQIAITRGGMLWQHRMCIDASGQFAMIIGTEFRMLPGICVLMA